MRADESGFSLLECIAALSIGAVCVSIAITFSLSSLMQMEARRSQLSQYRQALSAWDQLEQDLLSVWPEFASIELADDDSVLVIPTWTGEIRYQLDADESGSDYLNRCAPLVMGTDRCTTWLIGLWAVRITGDASLRKFHFYPPDEEQAILVQSFLDPAGQN